MEDLDLMRCECGQDATRRALVSTMPGSAEGRLFWLYLCAECYERVGWADRGPCADLAGERDMHELATGTDPDSFA